MRDGETAREALAGDGGLLQCHREMARGMLEADGMCVMASGLGLHKVLAVLLHLHVLSRAGPMLVVGSTERQRLMVLRELATRVEEEQLPVEVTNEVHANDRQLLYSSGAAVFVTTRIAVVDLLAKRLRPADISGMIICNSHKVTDISGEAFAARLFRGGNATGYMRALTDNPTHFGHGFNTVERAMKALGLRKLLLYPRFQSQVKSCLEKRTIDVVELEQDMSPAMQGIQEALIHMIEACVKELNKSNKIDSTNLTRDKALSRSFDDIIRRQLDSVWNTVTKKTKQLVYDLRTLRQLADYSLRMDPLSFLSHLDALRASEGTRSVWLFLPAAHLLFENAKKRVFILCKDTKQYGSGAKRAKLSTSGGAGISDCVTPVLEEPPKWTLLRDILAEVQSERSRLMSASGASAAADIPPSDRSPRYRALVVTRHNSTAHQLRRWLMPEEDGGGRAMMGSLWESYLESWVEQASPWTERQCCPSLKQRASGKQAGSQTARRSGRGGRFGGRSHGRSSTTRASTETRTDVAAAGCSDSVPGEAAALASAAKRMPSSRGAAGKNTSGPTAKAASRGNGKDTGRARAEVAPPEPAEATGLLNEVHWQVLENNEEKLWETEPSFVVLVDPQVSMVRQLEVYRAYHPGRPLRVYFLYYNRSSEKEKYNAQVRRETSVFDELIRMKGLMMTPGSDGKQAIIPGNVPGPGGMEPSPYHPGADPLGALSNATTRKALALASNTTPTVVVDLREFVSSLPTVLHIRGITVEPAHLEVGDYILSPEICVERKAIPDLIQSLQSGRLYQQAESMCRHYKTAVLLIEFEQDRAFALQAHEEMDYTISQNNLQSKIALLVLHFPRLRIIWSRSLYATADMFLSLKNNQEEPDGEACAAVGLPEVGPDGKSVGGESLVNQPAVDLLRKLPGVTERNYHSVMTSCSSLAELATKSQAELVSILGGEKLAKMLYEFIHAPCAIL